MDAKQPGETALNVRFRDRPIGRPVADMGHKEPLAQVGMDGRYGWFCDGPLVGQKHQDRTFGSKLGLADCGMTAVETEVVKSRHSFSADPVGLLPTVPLTRVRPDCANNRRKGLRRLSLNVAGDGKV